MEILEIIYPYSLYVLYALGCCAFVVFIVLLFKVHACKKALKLTMASVEPVKEHVTNTIAKKDGLVENIKEKNDQAKQFLKKTGLYMTVWHIFFPKKRKRRR